MRLIGMLDSPYVRRVAISLQLLDLRFEHEPLSVFRTFSQFAAINPVVKAPTLVCDDGTVLMDSTLILEYAETIAPGPRRLLPSDVSARRSALRVIGLALAACEKSVQVVYEQMRPPDKRHDAWSERVTGQLLAACDGLEAALVRAPLPAESATIGQDGLSAAVAWQFIQQMMAERVPAGRYPALAQLSARAEALAEFRAAPHGSSTYRVSH
jgi:glutathione S-transferase